MNALEQMARPESSAAIKAAGGTVPNLANLAQGAEQEAFKKTIEAATAQFSVILQSATAKATNLATEKANLTAALTKNEKAASDLFRARAYASATNNAFPLMKVLGLPVPPDTLTRFPDIADVPKDWTAPAASATTSA